MKPDHQRLAFFFVFAAAFSLLYHSHAVFNALLFGHYLGYRRGKFGAGS